MRAWLHLKSFCLDVGNREDGNACIVLKAWQKIGVTLDSHYPGPRGFLLILSLSFGNLGREALIEAPSREIYIALHCLLLCLFLADQIFYRSCVIGSIFVCGPLHHHVLLFSFLGAVGLFRSDMLLIFTWFGHDFPVGQFVCPQLPYRGNDMIIWIFPIVPCHAFCMWHWPIGRSLDLSFIWGHHHLSEYMDISRPTEYFIACYTVLTRPNNVETAVHGCNCWLSVWTLSCRCPVKLFT